MNSKGFLEEGGKKSGKRMWSEGKDWKRWGLGWSHLDDDETGTAGVGPVEVHGPLVVRDVEALDGGSLLKGCRRSADGREGTQHGCKMELHG